MQCYVFQMPFLVKIYQKGEHVNKIKFDALWHVFFLYTFPTGKNYEYQIRFK